MPELPEVETVRNGLLQLLGPQPRITKVVLRRKDLRRPFPRGLNKHLTNQSILGIRRRAKWLLWDTPTGIVLNHLGMTGSWRERESTTLDTHDHVVLSLSDGRDLIYRDPRRFGIIDWCKLGEEEQYPSIARLGWEPLDPQFTGKVLHGLLKKKTCSLKGAIMDQAIVVGVGNIYASEACYLAKINPTIKAGTLSKNRCDRLVDAIKAVLEKAIKAGGSTIRDFKQAGGSEGYFQHNFQVYGRDNEPCNNCDGIISSAVISGRNTFWCKRCQR